MSIAKLRNEIDQIDLQILKLLNERAKLVQEIGKKKGKKAQKFDSARETQIYQRLIKVNPGPLPESSLKAIYREIISASRALQSPLTIAFWGPPATFTHIAALEKFGSAANFLPVPTIPDVFAEVEKGNADFGVVPIENSTEGIIEHTLDMFLRSDLKICAEIYLPISHNLLSRADALKEVRKVYSTAQATAQCRNWLQNNLPHVELLEVSTTAKAAELASKEPQSAAIASALTAELYNLKILASRIEDNPYNETRFLVLGYSEPERTGKDKTSIMFSVPHRAGALYKALTPLKQYEINMTMIESRPTKQTPWEYIFFVDFEGHPQDARVKKALRALKRQCLFLRLLGAYPEA